MVISHNALFPKRCKYFVNVVSINTCVKLRQFLKLSYKFKNRTRLTFLGVECMVIPITYSFLTWRSQ